MFVFVCVCFACELVCCFFAVGVVKIWCSWFVVCVCVQGCACVSVFKAVRVCRCSKLCVCVGVQGCACVSIAPLLIQWIAWCMAVLNW